MPPLQMSVRQVVLGLCRIGFFQRRTQPTQAGRGRLAKDVIAFDFEFYRQVFEFFFSRFLGAQFAFLLHGRINIVFPDCLNDETATILDICGIKRDIDFLGDVGGKIGVSTERRQLLTVDEIPFLFSDS